MGRAVTQAELKAIVEVSQNAAQQMATVAQQLSAISARLNNGMVSEILQTFRDGASEQRTRCAEHIQLLAQYKDKQDTLHKESEDRLKGAIVGMETKVNDAANALTFMKWLLAIIAGAIILGLGKYLLFGITVAASK